MATTYETMITDDYRAAMYETGLWRNKLIIDYLASATDRHPDKIAFIDHNSMTGESTSLSYRELSARSDRMAVALARLGIEPGDVVAAQLPNWWQLVALALACVRIGAVINPLMPIFRQRELRFMLNFAQAKAVVVPDFFRGLNHGAMIEEIWPDLPALKHLLVIGGKGEYSFEAQLLEHPLDNEGAADNLFHERRPSADEVTQLMYTSGTTGEPKAVMHTANTQLSNVRQYTQHIKLDADAVVLMASPLAHQTGFLYGILMPIVLGARGIFQDIWNPDEAAALIEKHKVTYTMASTPFLADLTGAAAIDHCDISSLEIFLTAGAPIPRALVERAQERLKIKVLSAWGMTENGVVTASRVDDPGEKTINTDGLALDGFAVRVVDEETGAPLPTQQEGRLQARGASSFVGYLNRPEKYDTDADGWFETGDLAIMDDDGYIRISGRSKDIIIRGGENIPVVEIEQVLYRHPAVVDAAVVAMPDERLGELGCAFITFAEGQSFAFEDMISFLRETGMAVHYLPERLEPISEMPRTPSGKIQKFVLRDRAQNLTSQR